MSDVHIVVLAAGKGTRMKSRLPKVLHPIAGLPLLDWVLRAAEALQPASTTIVVGHEAERVRAHLAERPDVALAVQEPQLGTGHALLQAEPHLAGRHGTVVLLSGDVPRIGARTLRALVDTHVQAGAAATVATAVVDRPYGYGRIVRSEGRIVRIVEQRDASPGEQEIREINSGVYAFELAPLFDALRGIASENAQGEYYLPDLVGIYRRQRRVVETHIIEDASEMRGINSRSELAEVSAIVRQQKNEELMAAGVTLIDPATTYVDADVVVGADTVIHPGVTLEGSTTVGAACEIHSGTRIANSRIADHVTVLNHCVITGATIGAQASIGPFAHVRPATEIGEGARVGNFVELKKTTLGAGSKANHLSYLGDATIGPKVNVGAGTITCNYDGTRKHQTVIDEGAFIGSDSTLVAPVRIGAGAYVAAGSSITDDVPAGALGIARARQQNKDGWAQARRDEAHGSESNARSGAGPGDGPKEP
ncbi:MAG: bifunctional UDP-N-acetylglucosamine diphosphorylase/glucosamine-1-phosphate N-acetyltransferase GlmU [Vicinamibacterales bacterium]|nr:bifunctional UDP-N-acetylglucosamine diphosphorylase/glucosamine-1-phosphate N-acetyltransferase GlmU [Vicinamibacterales bacterium]